MTSTNFLNLKRLFIQGINSQQRLNESNIPRLSSHLAPKVFPEFSDKACSWYRCQSWSIRKWVILIVVSMIVLASIVIAVVSAQKIQANQYPDYSALNYHLVDTYQGSSFFDRFNYYSGPDPTYGFVVYVNEETAAVLNLTQTTDNSAILRVDSLSRSAPGGRNSVRIESKATYDNGLFIFDIIHTPYGCATWPALWLTDTYNWPRNGEIDVLEAHNEASNGNEVTLHTTEGCTMNVKRKHSGTEGYDTCGNSSNYNSGCGVKGDEATYGQKMNEKLGGVYALELRESGIRAWFFPRDVIPDDITNADTNTNASCGITPDPSIWGIPLADFPNTQCNIPTYFSNQSIIVNIDLCGELAALPQFYNEMYHCPATCESFVANSPSSFEEAYWEFASFKVYQAV